MRRPRHVPTRTCVGCREAAAANELVRLRAPAGALSTGSGPGRGAWLHRTEACVALAVQRKALSRALGVALSLSEESLVRLLTLGVEGELPTQV